MELKKSKKADLEPKRNIFFLIGLVVSLMMCLTAFEWKGTVDEVENLGNLSDVSVEDEIIPITRVEEIKPPPPPPPPKVVEVLNIVENDTDIDDELEIEDTEADEKTVIDIAPIIQEKEEEAETQVFFIVEEMTEFPGGERALVCFLASSVRYPVIAQENGVQGTVTVSFVIERDGSVSDVAILRSIDPSLDKEALRVVQTLPRWNPGKQRGKPVRVSYRVPIAFKLVQ